VLLAVCVVGVLGWRYQSKVIGTVTRWYLARVAARENASGDLGQRRAILARIHRQLLMPPPDDRLVPELFDFSTDLSSRVATGEVSFAWAAKLYTEYERDLLEQRPTGQPRRTPEQVEAELERLLAFYAVQKRPDAEGVRVGDLVGAEGDDVITLDEIEKADAEGREIDLRTRGEHGH
jgi:hypothetical protein